MPGNIRRQEECSVQKSFEWLHLVIICVKVVFCSNHHHKRNDRCPCISFDQVHRTVIKLKLGTLEQEFGVLERENTWESPKKQIIEISIVENKVC